MTREGSFVRRTPTQQLAGRKESVYNTHLHTGSSGIVWRLGLPIPLATSITVVYHLVKSSNLSTMVNLRSPWSVTKCLRTSSREYK
jgi:hypothetical protein